MTSLYQKYTLPVGLTSLVSFILIIQNEVVQAPPHKSPQGTVNPTTAAIIILFSSLHIKRTKEYNNWANQLNSEKADLSQESH